MFLAEWVVLKCRDHYKDFVMKRLYNGMFKALLTLSLSEVV